ncbi:MAG: M24 family metallopeptidase, partial [Haloferacaceae archaeon]
GDPVVVTVTPRGPGGYHARLSRTLAADGAVGAARRAHVACEAARRVAIDALEPGEPVDGVREEVVAELGAFGVEPVADAPVVHGVGLARREAPRPGEGATLEPGHVVAVAPAARVPDGPGTVRLADLVLVEADGPTLLTDVATGLAARS